MPIGLSDKDESLSPDPSEASSHQSWRQNLGI